ncbi:MAG: hypothetical protein EA365_08155 [Gloeocapsa sp. DLM2.Bin57]|nr:MAG: hypothetical protein EA365_08155 [Gloeocapsa sp. DLM2.Bin57]
MKVILASVLLLNLGLNSVPVLAQTETQPIPVTEVEELKPVEGSAADLANLDGINNQTDSWSVGGDNYPNNEAPTYQMRTESKDSLIIFEQNQPNPYEWEKQNHGDVPSQGGTVPLSRFR